MGSAVAEIAVEWGLLRYFEQGEKCHMIAICDCDHGPLGKCKKQMTCRKLSDRAEDGRGRPLGFLLVWLWNGKHSDSFTNHIHHYEYPSYKLRKRLRRRFEKRDDVSEWLKYERRCREGEKSEPRIA